MVNIVIERNFLRKLPGIFDAKRISDLSAATLLKMIGEEDSSGRFEEELEEMNEVLKENNKTLEQCFAPDKPIDGESYLPTYGLKM